MLRNSLVVEIKIGINHEYKDGFDECNLVSVISNAFGSRDINIRSIDGEFLISFDREFVEEVKYFEFWLIPSQTDFYYYTQLSTKQNEILLLSSQNKKSELSNTNIYSEIDCPLGAIGKVKLYSIDLSSKKVYDFEFKTKKTFWEYRILSNSNLYVDFEIIDDCGEYLFEKKKSDDEILFRSIDPIPYFQRAENRIILKFKQKNQYGVDDEMEVFLPYANFNSTIMNNGEIISVIFINL